MFIITSIILSVAGAIGFLNGSKQEQTLAFATIMLIMVLPIGSNNYTYPILGCLFVIAPLTLWFFRRMMQRLGESHINFPWQAMITMVIIVLMVQGALFHSVFAFSDGMDGQKRDISSKEISKISGMVTTKSNKDSLEELSAFLETSTEADKAIFFGGVPGLSYIFDIEPAIDTTWPDLDSYSVEKFEKSLQELSVSDEPEPMIILGSQMKEYANISSKYDILLDYINEHDYNKVFESESFIVFTSGSESED